MGKHDYAINKLKSYYEELEDKLDQLGSLYVSILGDRGITEEMDSIYESIKVLKELNEDE